jgi:hypothetical protein
VEDREEVDALGADTMAVVEDVAVATIMPQRRQLRSTRVYVQL